MSDRQVTSITGRVVEEGAIQKLVASVRGELLRPGDEGYESARRVWNRKQDKHPGMIVRCAGVADVICAIDFARTHGLLVAVRGGGHSYAGHAICDGGIVIDLSRMKGIQVDPVRRIVRAEAGLTVSEFDHATQTFGLATTLGECPSTGVAGLTLGGGFGFLMGKCGLSCDNLLSAEVVTADGQLITARAGENEDLLWGLRGGGGNFGVVTSLEYRLHPVSQVLGGMVTYPRSQAREVLRFFRESMRTAPDELTAAAGVLADRPAGGGSAFCIVVCYCGDLQTGEEVLRPLRSFGRPEMDSIRPLPYGEIQSLLDAPPLQLSIAWKGCFLRELSDEAIEVIAVHLAKAPSPFCTIWMDHLHGAVSRIGRGETAFSLRDAGYASWVQSLWEDSAQAGSSVEWVNNFWEALQPFSTGGVYVHILGDEGEERVKAAYGANYERLVALKNKYDPRV